MNHQYWHCEECGGNFDANEKCDCKDTLKVNVKVTSDMLVLGMDLSVGKGDMFCLTVGRRTGDVTTILNQMIGEEARLLYETLIGERTIGGLHAELNRSVYYDANRNV